VVVAGLQTSTSSKVGRGRDTLSPYMYRASAVFSTFSGNDESLQGKKFTLQGLSGNLSSYYRTINQF